MEDKRVTQYRAHRFRYVGTDRWYEGFGGDFGDHRCDDTVECQWRDVTTTTVTEYSEWQDTP